MGPALKENKSCWELSGVSSQEFSISAKPALSVQHVVGLNFKYLLLFSLLSFPLSESFQGCLLMHLHLNGEEGGSQEPLLSVMPSPSRMGFALWQPLALWLLPPFLLQLGAQVPLIHSLIPFIPCSFVRTLCSMGRKLQSREQIGILLFGNKSQSI